MMLLSPNEVLKLGLEYMGILPRGKSYASRNLEFHQHFGLSPLDAASMWHDLMETDIAEAQVSEKEKSQKGYKQFMAAHFWLWVYPKNSSLLASRFKICERYSREEHIKKWVKRIVPRNSTMELLSMKSRCLFTVPSVCMWLVPSRGVRMTWKSFVKVA
jgi:hypothetical protein